jgi:hypothetical protein
MESGTRREEIEKKKHQLTKCILDAFEYVLESEDVLPAADGYGLNIVDALNCITEQFDSNWSRFGGDAYYDYMKFAHQNNERRRL